MFNLVERITKLHTGKLVSSQEVDVLCIDAHSLLYHSVLDNHENDAELIEHLSTSLNQFVAMLMELYPASRATYISFEGTCT